MSDLGSPPPDDSWLPDVPAGAAPDPARKTPKRPGAHLRPVEALADDLDNAPIAGDPAPGDHDPAPPAGPTAPPDQPPPSGDRPRGEIWDGCPVRPLGQNGDYLYFLDALNQLRAVKKLEAQVIMGLFSHRIQALCWRFPKFVKDESGSGVKRKPNHFEHQLATVAMIEACGEKGLFNPEGAVRGVGAWKDDDGNLIYHAGDQVLIGDRALPPGGHDGKIYPAYSAIPHPAQSAKDTGPAPDILEAFATWNWARPEVDPMICLGMIGCQMLGGALDWRPTFWNTGSRASGKSTFQSLLKHLHGPGGLIQSTDATKSGITSQIGHSALPVALDELEPGTDSTAKEKAIIELARVASSGGSWLRGSADQKGVSGNVYSSFFFSSILIPGSMNEADLSRLVILSLETLPEGAVPPSLRPDTWRKRGATLKRQLIDRWPTWGARLDLWRAALADVKIGGRNADNYATIMAMADMAMNADLPTAEVMRGWAAKLVQHVKAEMDDIGSDASAVLVHLLTKPIDPYRRGTQHAVGMWLRAAGWRPGAGRRIFGAADGLSELAENDHDRETHSKRANAELARFGMRVVGTPLAPSLFVATAKIHGLLELFDRSPWAGGAWSQSLKRIPGAETPKAPRRLDAVQTKGTLIPFQSIPALMMLGDDEPAQAPDPVRADNIDALGDY